MRTTLTALAALTALYSVNVHAQDKNIETITVTATRAANFTHQPLAAQLTISKAQIELAQVQSVADLLARFAGIDIGNNGGRGQNTSVFIRGASSDHTLVLIDGVRIGSATNGAATWSTISPQLIERIEIVKGPRAAVWGSDAIGGVVNIITRKANKNSLQFGASFGSENTQTATAALNVHHGEGATAVAISHEASDGFDVLTSVEPDDDGYENLSASIKGHQQFSQFSLNWLLKAAQLQSDYDNAFGGANESETTNQEWKIGALADWQLGGQSNVLVANMGSARDKSVTFGNGIAKTNGSLFETVRKQISLTNTTNVNNALTVAIGSDLYQEEIVSTTEFSETERLVQGYFVHGLYQQSKISAELAVRYDNVEAVSSETTYNAGVGYEVAEGVRINLLRGTGFKAPTFNDLYFPSGQYSSGNPDLLSETSNSNELSVEYTSNALSASVSLYQTDINNLIDWAPGDDFVWRPSNISNATIDGLDLHVSYQGFGGQHHVNISYLDAIDATTQTRLNRRAKNQYGYQFTTQFNALEMLLSYQYKGGSFDAGAELDSYQLVDISFQYAVTNKLNANLKIHNLLDEAYQTVSNYNTQGLTGFIGVTYSL